MLYYCSWVCVFFCEYVRGMTEVDVICDNQEGLGCEYTSQPTASETSRPDLLSGPHVPAKVTKLWLSIVK